MKKILMMTTAIAGFAMLSAPASAAIDLDLGGHFRGYAVQADNDLNDSVYEKGFRRDTELHVTGETTLDNGLTVGAHMEFTVANGAKTYTTDETYAYFSGAWGRVNLGIEDGAAYLLQVSAPSADANVDGIAPTIAGADYAGKAATGITVNAQTSLVTAATGVATTISGEALLSGTGTGVYNFGNYKHATGSRQERVTYMTPKFNGFQAGMSYAVNEGDVASTTDAMAATKTASELKNLYELGARYDGEYQGFAFNLGAGYTDNSLAARTAVADNAAVVSARQDGVKAYNFGANVMFQNFSLGGAYLVSETQVGFDTDDTTAVVVRKGDVEGKTYVIGGAYDNGPYHVGISYLDQTVTRDAINPAADSATARSLRGAEKTFDRLTLGGGYSFGPGITFRGSVAWGEVETKAVSAMAVQTAGNRIAPETDFAKRDFTQIAIGTDVKF